MSIKVVCPTCLKKDLKSRSIIEIEENADSFLCPCCGETISYEEGVKAYKAVVKKYLRRSQKYLFYFGMPQSAYDSVAYLVNIDPTNFDARAQHLLSLIALSTVRKCYFIEASSLLDTDGFLSCINKESSKSFVNFIRNAFSFCKEYEKTLHKRLGIWKYFYDTDCVALYYRRTHEINDFLTKVLQLVSKYGKSLRESQLKTLTKRIEEFIKANTCLIDKQVQTIDGATYSFKNLEGNKTIITLVKKGRRDTSNDQKLIKSLDKTKGKRSVKDNIFSTSNGFLVALKTTRMVGFVSILVMIVDLVLHGIYKTSSASYALGVIGTILLCIFVLDVGLFFFIRTLIKNKKAI